MPLNKPRPWVALALCAAGLHTAKADESLSGVQCPLAPVTMPERYERPHQIPTEPAPDDPTHRMVTPGGMILQTPRMVEATDRLTITGRDSTALCFELETFWRNRTRCVIRGIARAEGLRSYVFRDDKVLLRIVPLAPEQSRVEPIGEGYAQRCTSTGLVDAATYTLRPSPR